MKIITANTLIGEVLRMSDKSAQILMNHGMGCVGCPSSQAETIEQAAEVHGLNVNTLLSDLNKEIGGGSKIHKLMSSIINAN